MHLHACVSEQRGDGEGVGSQALCACVRKERGDGEGAGLQALSLLILNDYFEGQDQLLSCRSIVARCCGLLSLPLLWCSRCVAALQKPLLSKQR
jgi:hypothetical protein